MSQRRFRPALLGALLASACLTPTDGSSRFGEARVQPEFAAGDSPTDLGVNVDSIHTVMERADGTPLVNAMMAYTADAEQAWIIELQSVADDIEVSIELLVGSNVAYRGARTITVSEGTAGRSPAENVPVSYIASDIAARVVVTPDDIAFGSIGASRQLQATVYDPNGVVLSNKTLTWASLNDAVALVDDHGLVTATGLGITSITASVDGVSGAATVFVDTALARTSTITADSASIAADGVSSTQISVRMLDANGQPVNASAGTVTLATTLGSLGAVTDHADGTYTATLTAGTTAGAAHVTGTVDGKAMSDSAVVEFRALTGDPGTTTITADSAALNADGVSTTRITVQVLDVHGNPVGASAGVVALTSTLGTLGGVTDHADGSYSATLTAGTSAGTAVISGTLNNTAITDTAGVVLRAVPSPTTTTITADSSALDANGMSTTLVTVRVLDVNGNPVAGSAGVVTLASTLGTTLSAVTDHADGSYTALLRAGTTAGLAVVSGTLNGVAINDTAGVQLRALADATTTTITADSAAIDADGASSTLVTVRMLDSSGNPRGASAGQVTLTTTLGSLGAVTDHQDGTYTATLTAGATSGLAIISGALDGVAITDTAGVVLRALPDPTTTTITADSAAMDANGMSTTLVTVRVLDVHGVPVGASAGVVTLTSTLGTTLSAVTDHADGTYSATLRAGTTAGLAIVSGTLNGVAITDTAGVQLRVLPDPTTTTITADSAAIDANGVSSTLVTVRIFDSTGHPRGVSGGKVLLTTTLGTLTAVSDHADGTYSATLTAGTTAGLAIVSGTLDGAAISDTAGVRLRALPDPTTTTITADSAAMNADGVSATLVTVRVLDVNGVPVGASAGVVTLASTLGTTLSAVTDHADGTYTAILKAGGTAGLAIVSGTLNGAAITDTAGVQLRSLPDPTTTTITADSAAMNADGVSATLVTVRVLDSSGNPRGISSGKVLLATTLGTLTAVTDHADGTYSATLTAGTTAGLAIISGTLDGAAITDTAGVVLRPLPDPTTTTITADSAALNADGVSTTLVTVRVLDANGVPVGASAGVVTLTSTLGTTLSAVTDHADGTYTATLKAGTTAGLAIVAGTLNGTAITDTAGVQLRALPDPTTTTITADSAAMNADGSSSTLVTVRVLDANGTPVGASAGVVTLASTLGTFAGGVADHGDGSYTATLTAGTVAGDAIITGTLAGAPIVHADTVVLRPVASPLTTTITADSASIVADGNSATVVTVRVLDVNGVPVGRSAGVVTLATTRGILSAIVDHQDGTYTATLRADPTTPDGGEFSAALVIVPLDTAVVTGTLNGAGIADSARVEFRPPSPDPEFQFTGMARNRISVDTLDTSAGEIRKQRLMATLRQP